MKKIALSFDDARNDYCTRAFPVMKKYNIPSTLNVISDYIRGGDEKKVISFPSSEVGMTKGDLLSCYFSGLVEIACHGAGHNNTREDIERNISDLRSFGINEPIFGFASPKSVLTEKNRNDCGVWDMVEQDKLLYVRSGIQIKREGHFYAALSLLDRYIHSDLLFHYLNRRNIIADSKSLNKHIIPSVAVFSYTKLHQIKSLIKKQADSTSLILMFHSILQSNDVGYGRDRYYWDVSMFESLCHFLKSCDDIKICMTKDLLDN